MEVKPFELQKHYEEVQKWFSSWDWPMIPIDSIPENGVIIEGVCAGFLYLTDSNIAIFDFIVSNREVKDEYRDKCLDLLVDKAIERAKTLGRDTLLTYTNLKALEDRLTRHGYKVAERGMAIMIRREDA